MTKPLKILILEDSVTDAELIQRLLKKEKMICEFSLAMDKEQYLMALDQFQPDVILSDNSLPQFNASEALKIVRHRLPDIPFILVTGTVSDEFAANIIKSGADDYILKDRLTRLPTAIDAALKQRKAEKEIADYKYALDQSAIISITDQKGIIKHANDNFCRISKYPAEELIGRDHRIINSGYHPKSYIKNLWTTIANGNIWRGEFRNRAKDGSIYWVDATIIPFLNQDGKPYQYLAIRVDITEKKKAEEKIQKSEEQYRDLVENITDLICTHGLDGRILSVNRAAEELIGHKFDPQENLNIKDILDPDKKNMYDLYIAELEKKGHVQGLMKIKSFSGKSHIWEYKNSLKTTGAKTTIVRGYARDVTESRKAEENLRQSEARLNEAQAIAHISNWEVDLVQNSQAWSDEFYRIYGINRAEAEPSTELFLSFMHPDDAEFAQKKVQEAFDSLKDSSFNFRFIRKDGIVRHGYTEWRFEFDKKGKPVRLFGILQDITERIEAEEEIRKSHERYEFVNKATQDTIWEWDYHTNKGKWGEGIITTFGYSEDKLVYDKNWVDEYVHPDDKEEVRKRIKTCKESGIDNWQDEYRFRCADGMYKYVYDRGFILYDENKKPYRMFGAMTDITEKKRLERELTEQQINQQKLITETTIQVQEKEKNELGRELHDNINQILATVKMYLGMVKAKENVSVDLVGQSYEYVTEAMEEIRKLSHSLVAPSLGDIGLKEALQGLVEHANLMNNLRVQLLFDEKYNEKDIDKNKELMLYRIVQEQMNNIIKYAKASKVVITFKTDDEYLILSVADDGVGFDSKQKSKGIGLKNINSRVEFYSGNMNIVSAPGQGCTLEVFIPC